MDCWWGDPSHRVIPHGTTERDIDLYHLRVDTRFAREDLDLVLPARRLEELARDGVVGRPARSHYSVMGYILRPLPTKSLRFRSPKRRECALPLSTADRRTAFSLH
jgi:hypothetical protein